MTDMTNKKWVNNDKWINIDEVNTYVNEEHMKYVYKKLIDKAKNL